MVCLSSSSSNAQVALALAVDSMVTRHGPVVSPAPATDRILRRAKEFKDWLDAQDRN